MVDGEEDEAADREAWDRTWRSRPHRRLGSPPRIPLGGTVLRLFGDPAAFTLSLDPPEYRDRLPRESSCCPICGEPTRAGDERLAATLHPRWSNGLGVGLGVWVHRACIEGCPDADEPAPIPW